MALFSLNNLDRAARGNVTLHRCEGARLSLMLHIRRSPAKKPKLGSRTLRSDGAKNLFGYDPVAIFIVVAKAAERKQAQRITLTLEAAMNIDNRKIDISHNG